MLEIINVYSTCLKQFNVPSWDQTQIFQNPDTLHKMPPKSIKAGEINLPFHKLFEAK